MKNKPSLSDKITKAAEKILSEWKIKNPDDTLLSMAQQVNLSGVDMRKIGSDLEQEYKRGFKGKIINDIH